MDGMPLINNIIEWDIRNWSRFIIFCEKFLREDGPKKGLEIGARNGGMSLYMALKGYLVICSDLNFPKDKARMMHESFHVADRIKYASVNVLDIPYEDNSFDLVIFKSVLGGLKTKTNQQLALHEIYRILKPDGTLLFAENGDGTILHKILRKNFVNWSKYWRYVSLKEVEEFSAIFRERLIETYGFLSCFGWNEQVRNLLGGVDSMINGIIPDDWRNIIFVYAKK